MLRPFSRASHRPAPVIYKHFSISGSAHPCRSPSDRPVHPGVPKRCWPPANKSSYIGWDLAGFTRESSPRVSFAAIQPINGLSTQLAGPAVFLSVRQARPMGVEALPSPLNPGMRRAGRISETLRTGTPSCRLSWPWGEPISRLWRATALQRRTAYEAQRLGVWSASGNSSTCPPATAFCRASLAKSLRSQWDSKHTIRTFTWHRS
jgi:hypothetical protein